MAKMADKEIRKERVASNMKKLPKKAKKKYFEGTKTGQSHEARVIKERNEVEDYYKQNL